MGSSRKVATGDDDANALDGESPRARPVEAAAERRLLLRVVVVGVGREKSRAEAGLATEGFDVTFEGWFDADGDEPKFVPSSPLRLSGRAFTSNCSL